MKKTLKLSRVDHHLLTQLLKPLRLFLRPLHLLGQLLLAGLQPLLHPKHESPNLGDVFLELPLLVRRAQGRVSTCSTHGCRRGQSQG